MQTAFPADHPVPPGFPQGAVSVAPAAELNFLHTGRVMVSGRMTAADVWAAVMSRPLPGLGLAFRLRDAISARFGVKRIGGFSGRRQVPTLGGHLDFFLVEGLSAQRMILTARDRHLAVMVCVTAVPCGDMTEVGLTASVKTHNRFGKIYMLPVAPAHRLIVRAMLRRLTRAKTA